MYTIFIHIIGICLIYDINLKFAVTIYEFNMPIHGFVVLAIRNQSSVK